MDVLRDENIIITPLQWQEACGCFPLPSPFGRRQEDSSGWCFGGQQLSEAQLINEANQFCQSVVSTLDLLWSFFTVTTEGCFRFLCSVFENAYIWEYSSMIRNEIFWINFTETEEKPKRGSLLTKGFHHN